MCCTSCSDSDPAPTPEEDETVSLIATLENERLWESGDEVLINGMKYTVEEGVGSAAATIKVPRAEHYYAAYDTGTGTVTENILSSEFTSTQNVSADMAPHGCIKRHPRPFIQKSAGISPPKYFG